MYMPGRMYITRFDNEVSTPVHGQLIGCNYTAIIGRALKDELS